MIPTASKTKPLASTLEYRLPVFPVVRQAAPRTTEIKWGGVFVERGNPTARHRDLLDAVLTVGRRVYDVAGQMHVVFDLSDVTSALGSETNWKGIKKMLLDLAGTVISIRHPGCGWPPAFPILTFVGDSKSSAERPAHQFPAKLKRITLSAGAAGLLAQEASVCLSRETVASVLALQHQVSRSVARWCLSHSNSQHHRLADVLVAVGAADQGEPISGRQARRGVHERVKWLREDSVELAKLGIDIDGETLHYHRRKGAFISAGEGVEALTPVVEAPTPVVEVLTPVP